MKGVNTSFHLIIDCLIMSGTNKSLNVVLNLQVVFSAVHIPIHQSSKLWKTCKREQYWVFEQNVKFCKLQNTQCLIISQIVFQYIMRISTSDSV